MGVALADVWVALEPVLVVANTIAAVDVILIAQQVVEDVEQFVAAVVTTGVMVVVIFNINLT